MSPLLRVAEKLPGETPRPCDSVVGEYCVFSMSAAVVFLLSFVFVFFHQNSATHSCDNGMKDSLY